jgi:hypothetical protein
MGRGDKSVKVGDGVVRACSDPEDNLRSDFNFDVALETAGMSARRMRHTSHVAKAVRHRLANGGTRTLTT